MKNFALSVIILIPPSGSCVGEWWPPWGGPTSSAWASAWWWREPRWAAARPRSWPWPPTPPFSTGSCASSRDCPPLSHVWRTWPRPSLAVRCFVLCRFGARKRSVIPGSSPHFSLWMRLPCAASRRARALSSASVGVQEGPRLQEKHDPGDWEQGEVGGPLASGQLQPFDFSSVDTVCASVQSMHAQAAAYSTIGALISVTLSFSPLNLLLQVLKASPMFAFTYCSPKKKMHDDFFFYAGASLAKILISQCCALSSLLFCSGSDISRRNMHKSLLSYHVQTR